LVENRQVAHVAWAIKDAACDDILVDD